MGLSSASAAQHLGFLKIIFLTVRDPFCIITANFWRSVILLQKYRDCFFLEMEYHYNQGPLNVCVCVCVCDFQGEPMSGGGMERDKVQSQIVTVQCPLWDGMGSMGHDTTTSADPPIPIRARPSPACQYCRRAFVTPRRANSFR